MFISDLYPTGLHEQNIGHFATIVRLFLLDKKIDSDELKLLKKMAKRLDISKSEFKTIIKNPDIYPLNPPVSYDERLERLYDLTKMMFLVKKPTIVKTSIMDRITIALGFPVENARQVVKEAINFFVKEPDMEDFKKVIKKANPIKH